MRFARLHCEGEGTPAGLEELATNGELNFVQLDYPRPRLAAIEGRAQAALPEGALGFTQAARSLVKTLYLEPEFRVITSAGWADAYGCVERAAAVLVDGGCGDMPMSAVRGSNLLPILEMLVAEQVDLKHATTGAPWRELREPILAADLQLGAGPLATALSEKARVVVAGCFDEAAPTLAAAVAGYGWAWHDYDRLASAAAAAHVAAWCDWQAEGDGRTTTAWTPQRVELDEAGRGMVDTTHGDGAAALRLQQWLRTSDESYGVHVHADIRLDLSSVRCTANGPRQLAVKGALGAAGDGCWRLEVQYQAGFAVEAMIEFPATTPAPMHQRLGDAARAHLQPAEDAGGLLTVESLQPLGDHGVGWLHVAYQSKSRLACQYFANQTLRLTAGHRPFARLIAGAPRVHVHCGLWPARVPRDAVDIAVETRLAKEWV